MEDLFFDNFPSLLYNKSMVKVSITIPVYNVSKYLSRCLDSIFKQDFEDFEVICVNDGSTDNSLDILKSYAEKYPQMKIVIQENQGLSVARNTGMEKACGKYIMFVDADDFLCSSSALSSLYNYAEAHSSEVVIFDFLSGTSDGKGIVNNHFSNIASKYKDTSFNACTAEPFVYRYIPVATWLKFYRADLVKNIKFVPDLNNQDVVHWAEVYTTASNINYFPKPFYYYVKQREGSITNIKGKKIFDVFKAFNLAGEILKNSPHYEKLKNIHYTHFCSNIVGRLRKIITPLRKEIVEAIQNVNIDINYETFLNEGFYPFEIEDVETVKFIQEHDFKDTRRFLIKKGIWHK